MSRTDVIGRIRKADIEVYRETQCNGVVRRVAAIGGDDDVDTVRVAAIIGLCGVRWRRMSVVLYKEISYKPGDGLRDGQFLLDW